MKKINVDLKYLIYIWIISLIAIIFTWGHHGHLILDCGREVYFPIEILKGKILYKDIFDIYGPFAYIFNAFLFKVFGINLNVLYAAGSVCALSIISLIYVIARKFLSPFISFSIAFYTISVGIISFHLFNFIFPYSFGMLYGFTLFLISLLLLLNYIEDPYNTKLLYASGALAGLSAICKYDFFLYILVILFAVFYVKKLKFHQKLLSLISLVFFPAICFALLFAKGLQVKDLFIELFLLIRLSNSKTLHYFYANSGVYFSKQTPWFLIRNFFTTMIPLSLFLAGFNIKKRPAADILITTGICLVIWLLNPQTFGFLPVLLLILGCFYFKLLKENKKLLFLYLSAFFVSLKIFWGLLTINYGVFFVSIILTAIFAILYEILKDKKFKFYSLGIYLIVVAIILAITNITKAFTISAYKVSSSEGNIYTTKNIGESSNELINYIKQNTNPKDKVIIYPEGAFINFYTQRSSDDYFLSLIPIYVEMYDENVLIKHFSETRPKYVIFNNWKTSDYYYPYICDSYAISFCNYISEKYTLVKKISAGDFVYTIYRID